MSEFATLEDDAEKPARAIEHAAAFGIADEPELSSALPKEPSAAPAPQPPSAPVATLVLKADLTAQRLTVIEDDQVLHVWAISSGRRGYATPTGTFRPSWMTRMWRSRQYDDAPMPHSIFFNKGVAFHATTAVSMLGRPASHGCLRLAPAHATELFGLVRRHGMGSTEVVVHGAPVFPPVAVARREPAHAKREAAIARQGAAGGGLFDWIFTP
jgi:lipoprotein-anchoring transpeptidase ErfK/SrfK